MHFAQPEMFANLRPVLASCQMGTQHYYHGKYGPIAFARHASSIWILPKLVVTAGAAETLAYIPDISRLFAYIAKQGWDPGSPDSAP